MRFAYAYNTISSKSSRDFLEKLIQVSPFKIKGIKTDNGSEFEGEVDRYIREERIENYYNYPRNPKGNTYIERFNRTIQESFVEWRMDILSEDIEEFNRQLMEYIIWYNTERPHKSLNWKSPLEYYVKLIETEFSNDVFKML